MKDKQIAERRAFARWVVRMTEGTSDALNSYERQLLLHYVDGLLTIGQLVMLLEIVAQAEVL